MTLFQYYEMSYGLNVEMHKQVSGFAAMSYNLCTLMPWGISGAIVDSGEVIWLEFSGDVMMLLKI